MLREVARFIQPEADCQHVADCLDGQPQCVGAIALYEDKIVHVPQREIDILDRVGGGDSFASGLIYGLLAAKPIEWVLRCGVATARWP